MSQVTKNIDEWRLRMKSHCPIVTDVGMKEKAIRVLMCYNPTWLRIGLYIIFGGDSLLSNGDINSDQKVSFLKMMIEKQFFTHAGLAKTYAYNKNVEDFLSSDVMHGEGNIIAHLEIVGYKVSYKQDSSILTKMVVPSDTLKKNLSNCGIALQYLRQAGLKLYDQDGTEIIEDDVANGDKELVLSLLWNMFVLLQLPLLINK
ncbi:hypothetical protein LWI29_003911 [Acer saccharum]|uniref:Uncharacterized protein n=1 Tax=Acer saccharum TaxID=4024 RepID=A0AA39RQS0_ACESA|nr:hypothetical protein LWI29_003911 [Acer saccharum]